MLHLFIQFIAALGALYFIFWLVLWARRYFRLPSVLPDTVFPDSKFIEVAGFRIRYIQRGPKSSPDLVLIHGLGASIYGWRHVLDELTQSFRVTAFDLPGFGLSDKHVKEKYGLDEQTRRVFQLLDQLKIKNFFIVGHSMGGSIAAWMTKTSPSRVLKVGLLAPAVDRRLIHINPDFWWWGLKLLKNFIVTPQLVKRIYLSVCTLKPPENLGVIIEHYYKPYHQRPEAAETFFKHLHLIRDSRLTQEMVTIERETLVIYGEKDPVIRKKSLISFLEKNPLARLCTIAGAGHLIAEETPHLVTKNLLDFFTTRI